MEGKIKNTIQKWIPVIDTGHGNDTKGKCSPKFDDGTQLFEYKSNRELAIKLIDKLEQHNIRYYVLTPEIWDVPLSERIARANKLYDESKRKTFVISLHSNAGGGTGIEIFTSVGNTKSDKIASIFYKHAEEVLPQFRLRCDFTDGDPDKEYQYAILKNTRCPAILIENLFMDTESDCRYLMSEEGQDRIVEYMFRAIKEIITTDL